MTPFAIAMSRPRAALCAALLGLAAASPALARDQDQAAANREPDAEDVVMTPVTDLGLKKEEIPPVLQKAMTDPYASAGLSKCPAIQAAIGELDAALGPDMDVSLEDADRLSTGRVAKSIVGSFIPFRGILRELTGAASHRREYEAAVYAGSVRRGYLKGIGQQKGCAYPARPAAIRATLASDAVGAAAKPAAKSSGRPKKGKQPKGGYVSEPVVQPVPDARPGN